ILEILEDIRKGLSRSIIACKFHNALAESALGIARLAGVERVVLTGGCFQNKYLTERTVTRLQAEGFRVSWHQRVPPNDGGVALGQVVAALRQCRTNFSDRQDDQGRPGRVALSTCEAAS